MGFRTFLTLYPFGLLLSVVLLLTGASKAAEPVVPAAGSPEWNAICDEMRNHLWGNGEIDSRRGQFLFKIQWIKVQGDYAAFQGSPVTPDGSTAPWLPNVVYTAFLKRGGSGWAVVADLSRANPSDDAKIRSRFPKEIPTSIIPESWRGRLGR